MTSSDVRAALLSLMEQWEREAVESDDDEYSDRSDAYRDCADAVRALLATRHARKEGS